MFDCIIIFDPSFREKTIANYLVTSFAHIAEFSVLNCSASIMGGAHRYVNI